MEKVKVESSFEAYESFEGLRKGPPLVVPLAVRFYNELFGIPPETWGRIRRENKQDTFVSEKHCVFDIRGIIEDTHPARTLNITHFELRKKPAK